MVQGWFSYRTVDTLPPPDMSTVLYEIKFPNGTDSLYKFQWIAKSRLAYENSQNFTATCMASPAKFGEDDDVIHGIRRDFDDVVSFEPEHVDEILGTFPGKISSEQIIPIVNSTKSSLGVYQVGNRTMVMYVGTFAGLNQTEFFETLDQVDTVNYHTYILRTLF